MIVAGALGALGLFSIMSRKTFLGVLVGIQILIMGATIAFVLAGILSHNQIDGPLFAFFIVLSGVIQLVAGYALMMRLYSLKSSVELKDLESLKQ